MRKTYTIIMVALGAILIGAFLGFAIWQSASGSVGFAEDGFILRENQEQFEKLSFKKGDKYSATLSGLISFRNAEGKNASVVRESFVHFADNTTSAFSDGVLLDFNDLSENFINNYYIPAGMMVADHNGTYIAETTAGALEFGEHMWKLSDRMYLLQSPELKVHFSEEDVREAGDLVQVYISDDSLVYIQTEDEMWSTISPDCYIRTEKGVKVYPVSLLVDSGRYKMSLAKLAVNTDDAIVLTESETRRQIVPELNIEAIDGEDGDDGTQGAAGQAGRNGEEGEEGEDGEGGKAGKGGSGGEIGSSGNPGKEGKDAFNVSSTYNALPTMSTVKWEVTADSISGSLKIVDEVPMLIAKDVNYPGRITLTNKETGEVLYCRPYGADGNLLSTEVFDFEGGSVEEPMTMDFGIDPGALTPDTEYTLSVTAFYRTQSPAMVYEREFISRDFTTDSTGVSLSWIYSTTKAIQVKASIDPDVNVQKVKVFLLTPKQNEAFTKTMAESITANEGGMEVTDQFVQSWTADISDTNELTIDFGVGAGNVPLGQLAANKDFIVRAYVVSASGANNEVELKTLSRQELEVSTLKQTPTFDKEEQPRAIYNRTNGQFEVWRPKVTDPDGGAVFYTYTAYENGVEVTSRKVPADAAEPIQFALPTGVDKDGKVREYTFGVVMEVNDNEKTLTYDLGTSNVIAPTGDTLPWITWVEEPKIETGTLQYNKLQGKLKIPLGRNSSLLLGEDTKLEVALYADGIILENVARFTAADGVAKNINAGIDDLGKVSLSKDQGGENTYYLELNLQNLRQNTSYAITVRAYVDLEDGSGSEKVQRSLGTVTFSTPATPKMKASWVSSDTEGGFSVTVRVYEDNPPASGSYAEGQLKNGQAYVILYRGSGSSPQELDRYPVTDAALTQLYTTGLEITDDLFPNAKTDGGETYTLTLSQVVDGSCFVNGLGYINTFTNIDPSATVISATKQPPDLRPDPWNAITVTKITKGQLGSFGVNEDDPEFVKLPSDTVVGFTLAADYKNTARIGKSVTYYAYEYMTMRNKMNGMSLSNDNPLNEEPLLKMTVDIDSGSDDVPKVAIIFGGTKTGETAGKQVGQYYVFRSGAVEGSSAVLASGMGRGYRYIFAYTAQYAVSSQDGEQTENKTYPNDAKNYDSFSAQYGGLTLGVKTWGRNAQNSYILNSGMVEVPNLLPTFYTYVKDTTDLPAFNDKLSVATGKVNLHYTWRDPDNMIKTGLGESGANTAVLFKDYINPVNNVPPDVRQDIAHEDYKVDKEEGEQVQWYSVSLPFTVNKPSTTSIYVPTLLEPKVTVGNYNLNYNNLLKEAQLTQDEEYMTLTQIPVDWPYDISWNSQVVSSLAAIKIGVDTDRNALTFRFEGENYAQLTQRAVAIKVELGLTGTETWETFYAPLNMYNAYPEAAISVGKLGSKYEQQKITINSIELIYDSGLQGWQYAEDTYFAFQFTDDGKGHAGYSGYLSDGSATSELLPASRAMRKVEDPMELADLRKTLKTNPKQDEKTYMSTRAWLFTETNSGHYMYPTANGVDVSGTSPVEFLSGQRRIPKKLSSVSMKSFSPKDISVTGMTPTMTRPTITGLNGALLVHSFKVSGLTGQNMIHVAAYLTLNDAQRLTPGAAVEGTVKTITVPADGQVNSVQVSVPGEENDKTYYLAFYYMDENNQPKILRNEATMEPAAFEASTSNNVTMKQVNVEYLNTSYFTKVVNITYTMNRPGMVRLSADLFTNKDCTGDAYMTYAQLREKNILTSDLAADYNGKISLNLTPREERSSIIPGGTYYLKLQATQVLTDGEGNEVTTPVGDLVIPFSITEIGNYGALIQVTNLEEPTAGNLQIKYRVTINDKQKSMMAPNSNTPLAMQTGALYAVRFVDQDNKILKTPYDDQVFSANAIQQPFTLESDKMYALQKDDWNKLKTGQDYTMLIFALPDPEHDGKIMIYDENQQKDVGKTADDFFISDENFEEDQYTDSQIMEMWAAEMNELIDSFWWGTGSGANYRSVKSHMQNTMNRMLIAQKTQNTGSGKGYFLNTNLQYVTPKIKDAYTVRVEFQESFNLIYSQYGQMKQRYPQIDYSIEGTVETGTSLDIINLTGTLKESASDTLFQIDESGVIPIYYLELPASLSTSGNYTLTLHFYTKEVEEGQIGVPDEKGSYRIY